MNRNVAGLLRWIGVTLDPDYQIKTVDAPPPLPATPVHPDTDTVIEFDVIEGCFFHGPEPIPAAGYYRLCIECGHIYPTADDLRAAYLREVQRLVCSEAAGRAWHDGGPCGCDPLTVPPTDEISFCQECTHDF